MASPLPAPATSHLLAASESDSGIHITTEPVQRVPDQRSDFIEQIFQKVEMESERRAQEEHIGEERSRPSTASRPASAGKGAATPSTRDATRERRRGSISVSRFGQATDLSSGTYDNPSNLPSRKNSLIIKVGNTGAFYKAQKHAGSADSFASDNEDGAPTHDDVHDEEQVTQMETIAGRVSLGKAMGRTIARRLSRARTRSRDILAVPNGLVIGVSVEEATTEAEHQEDGDGDVPMTPSGMSFVYAQASEGTGSRSRRSTVSMPNPPSSLTGPPAAPAAPTQSAVEKKTGWVAKAKDFTRMIKRRSMAVLPQQNSNSSP